MRETERGAASQEATPGDTRPRGAASGAFDGSSSAPETTLRRGLREDSRRSGSVPEHTRLPQSRAPDHRAFPTKKPASRPRARVRTRGHRASRARAAPALACRGMGRLDLRHCVEFGGSAGVSTDAGAILLRWQRGEEVIQDGLVRHAFQCVNGVNPSVTLPQGLHPQMHQPHGGRRVNRGRAPARSPTQGARSFG